MCAFFQKHILFLDK
uniref:Uncharacterized protein n=1 Tax=Anguilla anguilla TaxID=7936 RepID=A0A0E9TS01_ANGAN